MRDDRDRKTICLDCGHLYGEGNLHGFDQNDGYLVDNGDGGYILIHRGRCTYCKVCRAGAPGREQEQGQDTGVKDGRQT